MLCLKNIKKGNNIYCLPGRFHPFFERKSLKKRETKILPKYISELQNHNFTILSNDCIGGVISHELKEQQRSPFVNTYISPNDFYKLLSNFDYYMGLDVVDITRMNYKYPVGCLGDIKLWFIHYSSFHEAKKKWDQRKKRINKNNLFITVFDYTDKNETGSNHLMDYNLFIKYLKLPFRHLVIFTTDRKKRRYKNVIYLGKYRSVQESLVPIDIEMFGGHRIFDYKFNFVNWLNDCQ